jgi:hypothetical protein
MDNLHMSIKYFLLKLKFKKFIIFTAITLFLVFVTNSVVYAVPYGEGNYGDKLYGEDFPPSSPATAPGCNDTAPHSAPTITLATALSTTQIKLTFTHAADPVTYYALEYGPEHQKYLYSATNIGGKNASTYTVEKLSPNSTYYFHIRAGNGCMTGEWSSEVSAKTLSFFGNKSLDLSKTVITPVEVATTSGKPTNTNTTSEVQEKYDVSVSVVNTQNEPIEGATVTLHSTPQQQTTDAEGAVQFSGIEAGAHTLQIAYGDYSGEESIYLTGQVKEFKISITVEEKQKPFSRTSLVVISILAVVIIFLLTFFFLKSRKKS